MLAGSRLVLNTGLYSNPEKNQTKIPELVLLVRNGVVVKVEQRGFGAVAGAASQRWVLAVCSAACTCALTEGRRSDFA